MLHTDTPAQFQTRRSDVRKRSLRWALGIVPLFVALPMLDEKAPVVLWSVVLPLGVLAFYSAWRIVALVSARYRCPACEKLVTEGDGINPDPSTCPHCGAALK